jgi:hypothetical protein
MEREKNGIKRAKHGGFFCAHLAEVTVTRRRGGAADTRLGGVTALTGFLLLFLSFFLGWVNGIIGEPIGPADELYEEESL